jgi:hypothetical protein
MTACARPAHKNTWFTGYNTQSVMVRIYSPDTFEMDGFMVNSEGLARQIQLLQKGVMIKRLIIEPMADASLFDQAVALHIGEDHGLQTYRVGLFGTHEISSQQVLSEMDESRYFEDDAEASLFPFSLL